MADEQVAGGDEGGGEAVETRDEDLGVGAVAADDLVRRGGACAGGAGAG